MTRNPNHGNADDLMAVAVAICAVADSCPATLTTPTSCCRRSIRKLTRRTTSP
jgi:hypothetical protein